MKIIHLSDLHIPEGGKDIWSVNPVSQVKALQKRIKEINYIDAIFISGDISNDGSNWSYEFVDKVFSEIGIPTYCCPGNHDNLNMFFGGYTLKFIKTEELLEMEDWTFIFLNSAVPGMARGIFNIEKLENLLNHSNGNVAVVLHHPPIEQEGWLNRKLLENRNEFNEIIIKKGNIKLVLYGHTHSHSIKKIGSVIYSSATSVGFAFSPKLPKFEIADGMEGFSLITLEGDRINIENILI